MKSTLYWSVHEQVQLPWAGTETYKARMCLKSRIEAFYSGMLLTQEI